MGSILGWLLAGAASVGAGLVAIPRQLWHRWRERIVDRLDQAVLRGVSRFDRRYREFVLSRLRFVDLKGLATVGFYTPELDDVFVDVSLAYRAPHEVPEDIVDHPGIPPGERLSMLDWQQTIRDRLQQTVKRLEESPSAGDFTSMRLGALRLAMEHDPQAELAQGFRRIAAGVTLHERRLSGKAPATETTVLAT